MPAPYNLTTASPWVRYYWKRNPIVITATGNAVGQQLWLKTWTSQNGNRLTPNPQTIVRMHGQNWRGSTWNIVSGWQGAYNERRDGGLAELEYDQTWDDGLHTAAFNSALSGLNDAIRGNLDLTIDGFQAQQTTRMVRSAMHMVETARTLRRNLLNSGWRGSTRELGSRWLEYQYGWKPTVNTIYDAFSKIVDPTSVGWERLFHSRSSRSYSYTSFRDSWLYTRINYNTVRKARCEIGVVISPSQSHLQRLAGYSSLNPVSILWELMPYSFVIDWFIDIGGYLRNAETALIYGNLFKAGYVTYGQKNDRFGTAELVRSDGKGFSDISVPAVATWTQKRRTVITSYPLPRLPVFEARLGSARLLSAAALLSQVLEPKGSRPGLQRYLPR